MCWVLGGGQYRSGHKKLERRSGPSSYEVFRTRGHSGGGGGGGGGRSKHHPRGGGGDGGPHVDVKRSVPKWHQINRDQYKFLLKKQIKGNICALPTESSFLVQALNNSIHICDLSFFIFGQSSWSQSILKQNASSARLSLKKPHPLIFSFLGLGTF